jgi:hypothetical protein
MRRVLGRQRNTLLFLSNGQNYSPETYDLYN